MPAILSVFFLVLAIVLISYYGAHVTVTGGKHIPLTVKPEQFGLPYEPVEFQTKDSVKLRGWFIPGQPTNDRTILFCHGWGANKGEVLRGTHGLRNFGFNLSWWDRALGTYRPQPERGHLGMTIGLDQFRAPAELRLDRMLLQPWRGAAGAYPLGRE